MPTSFFDRNSAVYDPITSSTDHNIDISVPGAGMRAVPCTADFLLLILLYANFYARQRGSRYTTEKQSQHDFSTDRRSSFPGKESRAVDWFQRSWCDTYRRNGRSTSCFHLAPEWCSRRYRSYSTSFRCSCRYLPCRPTTRKPPSPVLRFLQKKVKRS